MRARLLLPALLLLASRPALAADAGARTPVRLTYQRAPGAESCPDEPVFRAVVAARTSFDPFRADAPEHLSVVLTRRGRTYVGRAELRDARGALVWPRELAPMEDCASVVEGLGFAVAVKLDPAGPPPAAPPPSAPAPAPPPVAPLPARDAPVPPAAPAPRRFRLSLAGLAGFGLSPAVVAGGAALGFGVAWQPVTISIEARAFPVAKGTAEGGGMITIGRYAGALVPCAHWRLLAGCAQVELGALRATSDAAHPQAVLLFQASLGLRAAVEVPIVDRLALRVSGDALFGLLRSTLQLDGRTAWVSPVASATLGGGLVTFF
jgi:hypothetical protein